VTLLSPRANVQAHSPVGHVRHGVTCRDGATPARDAPSAPAIFVFACLVFFRQRTGGKERQLH
jgi:hypothetical protein